MDFHYGDGAASDADADPADASQWGGRGRGSQSKANGANRQQDQTSLYGLEKLASFPGAPVMLVASREAADAAQGLFPSYVCLSWCRSIESIRVAAYVNLTPLQERSVTLWPDGGGEGQQAAAKIKSRLPVAFEVVTTGLPTGFNATDLSPECSGEWLKKRLQPVEPDKLKCVALEPIGAANIPPRPWAYGNFLLFGYGAVIGAQDGGGKGFLTVTMIIEMITGRSILGERIWRSGPVAIVTYEDDLDEWHRRFAAACMYHRVDYAFVLQNIRFLVRDDRKITFCEIVDDQPYFPDRDEILAGLKDSGAIGLVVDPFNHAHSLESGNENTAIAKVAFEMNDIARKSGCFLLLLHHLRKGSTGSADDLMGATSLRATFRSTRILVRMSKDEAGALGIKEDVWRYTRIAGSKENFAPPPDKAHWYKLESQRLGNGTEQYPDGDSMGVATHWKPSEEIRNMPLFGGMSGDQLLAIFDAIRTTPHSPVSRSKQLPWIGKLLQEVGGRDEVQAKTIIKLWDENAVTRSEDYRTETRNDVQRVVLNETKVAEIIATYCRVDRPTEDE
ncbi:MAG: AAA family ATPase [Rhodopila sp.]